MIGYARLIPLLVACTSLAQAAPDPALPAKLGEIKAQLGAVQAQLDQAIAAVEQAPPPTTTEELQEQISMMEEDIAELMGTQEKHTLALSKDRVNWTVAYRATLNNVYLQDRDDDGDDAFHGGIWNHRIRLGLNAAKGPLRFSGRFAVYKNFGESDETPIGFDSNSTRYPRDTTLRLERAFLDLFINDWLAFTLGRVASPEGPPAELKENSDRSGTWGVQMVEAAFETILVTFKFKPIESSLRIFYSPFFSHAQVNPQDDNSLFEDNGIKSSHIWGLLFESKVPKVEQSIFQLGFVHVPKFRPQRFSISNPQTGDRIEPLELPDTVGGYVMINALIELKDLAGLDMFVGGSTTFFSPGDAILYDMGGPEPFEMGLASFGEDNNRAAMGYAGLRYRLPVGAVSSQFGPELAPKIGLEYNYGTKHHVSWGSPSETLINKLGVRGHAVEAYTILPLCPDLFMRLGALHVMRDYKGGFFGPSVETDEKVTNLYLLINARWM